MKSILLYHLYLVNNWKAVTTQLLAEVPHDTIIVNLSFDLRYSYEVLRAYWFLKKYKQVKKIFVTQNNAKYGEILGFEKFRQKVNYEGYDILTYMHGKGVTKPQDPHVADWREFMRYFIVDRFDLTQEAFEQGYGLYGVNLFQNPDNEPKYAFKHTDYIFRGNFVSLNLHLLKEAFLNTRVAPDYYSVEGFWGKLCPYEKAYSPHNSGVHHYKTLYPPEKYKEGINQNPG